MPINLLNYFTNQYYIFSLHITISKQLAIINYQSKKKTLLLNGTCQSRNNYSYKYR